MTLSRQSIGGGGVGVEVSNPLLRRDLSVTCPLVVRVSFRPLLGCLLPTQLPSDGRGRMEERDSFARRSALVGGSSPDLLERGPFTFVVGQEPRTTVAPRVT